MCHFGPKNTKKSCFVSKNCGSIPEWNFGKINITAGWFNSLMESGAPFVHSPPPHNTSRYVKQRTTKRKGTARGWSLLERTVSKVIKKGLFPHKRQVTFQNGKLSKKTSQPLWFNSRIEILTRFARGRLPIRCPSI